VFSDIIAEDNHSISNPDPLVSPMQLSDVSAELAPQQHPIEEAPPLNAPARMPIGDDSALPYIDDTIPVVSQLGSLDLLPNKQIKVTRDFSDVTSKSFPSIMLSHLNSLVSQFESFGNTEPFSSHSNDDIDFAAMQSIIDQ
jgi:hypothetical protein